MQSIRLVIIGDNQIFREGINKLLNYDTNIIVEAMVSRRPESLTKIKLYKPNLIVFNILSPEIETLSFIAQILTDEPEIDILVVGFRLDAIFIEKLRALNIKGYVASDLSATQIVSVVHSINEGKFYFDNKIIDSDYPNKEYKIKAANPSNTGMGLSKREVEILKLVLDGYKSRQVATELSISIRTVQNHRAHIMKKLRAKNMSEMIRITYEHNLLQKNF